MPRHPDPPPPKRRSPNTGSVIQRRDGRVAVVLPPDLDEQRRPIYSPGRRIPFASREEAERWLDAEVRRRRSPPATASPDELLGAYLARWFSLHEDEWPERTRSAYRASLVKWRGLGNVRLGGLTREVVDGETAKLRRATWQRRKRDGTPVGKPRPYSPRTIAHARSVLHQALDDLIPDVLAYNPARARRRGRNPQEPEQPVWSSDQVAAFLKAADQHEPRYALGFRLILRRALRVGETIALTKTDVNERAMTLTIDQTVTRTRGKDGPTKTRRIRDVPLSVELLAAIRAHERAYPTTDPHLLTMNGRAVAVSHFRWAWHRVVRLAGLPAISPKDGRATCATLLLDAGEPLPVVAGLLGHTSIAVTARFYARVLTRRRSEVEALGERLDATLDRASERA